MRFLICLLCILFLTSCTAAVMCPKENPHCGWETLDDIIGLGSDAVVLSQ